MCSYDLPLDVFGPDETKPSRPKRRIAKKSKPAGVKRRLDINGVEVCVSIGPFKREATSKGVGKTWKIDENLRRLLTTEFGGLLINIQESSQPQNGLKRRRSDNGAPAAA